MWILQPLEFFVGKHEPSSMNPARQSRSADARAYIASAILAQTGRAVDEKSITNTYPQKADWEVILENSDDKYPKVTITQITRFDLTNLKAAIESKSARFRWRGGTDSSPLVRVAAGPAVGERLIENTEGSRYSLELSENTLQQIPYVRRLGERVEYLEERVEFLENENRKLKDYLSGVNLSTSGYS